MPLTSFGTAGLKMAFKCGQLKLKVSQTTRHLLFYTNSALEPSRATTTLPNQPPAAKPGRRGGGLGAYWITAPALRSCVSLALIPNGTPYNLGSHSQRVGIPAKIKRGWPVGRVGRYEGGGVG